MKRTAVKATKVKGRSAIASRAARSVTGRASAVIAHKKAVDRSLKRSIARDRKVLLALAKW